VKAQEHLSQAGPRSGTFEQFAKDVRYALRQFANTPGFTATA